MARTVLAVGAHPDDVELGCGGTLARHVAAGDHVHVLVLSDGASGAGDPRTRQGEARRAAEVLGFDLELAGLPDGDLPAHQRDLVRRVEAAIHRVAPHRIYTHTEFDTHQDHRAVARATWAAARAGGDVLGYESPSSYDFRADVHVDITDALEKKVEALRAHGSQVAASRTVDLDAVRARAGHRGFEARTGAAEAFRTHRLLLEV